MTSNHSHHMEHDGSFRGFLVLLAWMSAGQSLMILGEVVSERLNVMLFSLIDLDQVVMVFVHMLSGVSFFVTILIGVPKALAVIKNWNRKVKRKKRIQKNKKQ